MQSACHIHMQGSLLQRDAVLRTPSCKLMTEARIATSYHCTRLRRSQRRSTPRRRLCVTRASVAFERAAAELLIQEYVKDGQTVSLGSGRLATVITQCLAVSLQSGSIKDVAVVPASDAAAAEALMHGVPVRHAQDLVSTGGKVDVLMYDCDCVDKNNWATVAGRCDEGRHQPQLARLRSLQQQSRSFVAILQHDAQLAERLVGWLPVVIQDEGWEATAEQIDDMFLGDAEIWRRSLSPSANPRGGEQPYISLEGHNIIDVRFDRGFRLDGKECEYSELVSAIERVPGVVTHGLFLEAPSAVLVASANAKPQLLRHSA